MPSKEGAHERTETELILGQSKVYQVEKVPFEINVEVSCETRTALNDTHNG